MDHFFYHNGVLQAEGVALPDIANEVGTPFYVYSAATFRRHYKLFEEALEGMDHLICFAMKANGNLAILKLMADMGAGIDVLAIGNCLLRKEKQDSSRQESYEDKFELD